MLLVSWELSCKNRFGALSPLSIHQIGLLELELEEPVSIRFSSIFLHLTTYNKPLRVSSIPGSSLFTLFKERLDLVQGLKQDVFCFLETPRICELVHFRSGQGGEFGKIGIDARSE